MLQHFKITVFIREKTQTIKEYRKKKIAAGKEKIGWPKVRLKGNVYEASALNYDLNTAISALSRTMFFLSTRDVSLPLLEHLS